MNITGRQRVKRPGTTLLTFERDPARIRRPSLDLVPKTANFPSELLPICGYLNWSPWTEC